MENSLFNQPESQNSKTESLYYVTNHMNLREILNSHYIGSLYSFDNKYYEDLLTVAPGYIPFVSVSMIPDACGKVSVKEMVEMVPVILEFTIDTLKTGDEMTYCSPDYPGFIICLATARAVPSSKIQAIHFLSENDKEEVTSREWAEIVHPVELYKVSPHLHNVVGNSTGMYNWLSELPPVTNPQKNEYIIYDRIAGAITLCAARSGFEAGVTEKLLSLIGKRAIQNGPSFLPVWIKEGIHPEMFGVGRKAGDEERALFTATLSVLYRHTWETVGGGLIVVEEIEHRIEDMKLSKDAVKSIKNKLDIIRGYLRNESPLAKSAAKPGYEVSKALTLFLMRTSYDQLSRWPSEETLATEEIMLTALIFAGVSTGFKNITTNYRTNSTDDLIARQIIKSMFEIGKSRRKVEKTKVFKDTNSNSGLDKPEAVLPAAQDFRSRFATLDHTSVSSKALVLELCRFMKWDDCIKTRITITEGSLAIFPGNITNIEITGVPSISYEVDRLLFDKFLSDGDSDRLAEFEKVYFPIPNT